MIHTLRLNLPYSETESMEDVASRHLATVGLTLTDITVNVRSREDWSTHTHFGNWCIVPVLDVPMLHTLNVDYPGTIIEADDLTQLHIGQKVYLQYMGTFGMATEQGTIHKFTTIKVWDEGIWCSVPCVEIFKKGTRSGKGWRVAVGDCANIWPVIKEM
jgi:hypothetical protein